MSTTTPLMRQFLEIKSDHQDAILFFRLGDFYEMFMDDAVIASKILGITLTSRNKGDENAVPLCGVPYHSSQGYIAKLVAAGHKVAICEQVEDPETAKGIVKREVVKVVTPGLITDTDSLEPKENNYLLSLAVTENAFGIAHVDITTGSFRVTQVETYAQVESEISSIRPREIILSEEGGGSQLKQELLKIFDSLMCNQLPEWVFTSDYANEQICSFYSVANLTSFGCEDLPAAQHAAAAILHYLQQTRKDHLRHLQALKTYRVLDYMLLDDATRRNLELTATLQDGKKKGSLLGVLDRTVTAMGGRTLRHWIHYPLIDLERIKQRQAAVTKLVDNSLLRMDLREALDGVYDLERLNGKISMAGANARDLVSLRDSLARIPVVTDLLASFDDPYLAELRHNIDPLPDLEALLGAAVIDDPPVVIREGGIIRDGYSEELDELRLISREGKGWIAAMEVKERERTGISSLKIKYNRVFGYFIEVTHRHLERVPDDYQRKQTLVNAERYITTELKDIEAKVLGAEERMADMEYDIFQEIRRRTAHQGARIQRSAEALAIIDVLVALADLAHERRYICPQMDESGTIRILAGRHPVIEGMPLKEAFVPNDVMLDNDENQLLIITGPNMAGKSTFMRQVALITLMAQIGSHVPAELAQIGVVDRIFTRVGASDNLAKGESTFMVEMNETANILRHATPRSLIVLDEIGRGTSTYDGVSIAWAVAEYLHDNPEVAAKTLFATHYHELTDLAESCSRVKNYNVAVKEWNDQIIFLRKIVAGGASRSYGIQVGRLAGLPEPVIRRAKGILKDLETGERDHYYPGRGKKDVDNCQLSLFVDDRQDQLRERLEALDISHLTPLEALNILADMKKLVE